MPRCRKRHRGTPHLWGLLFGYLSFFCYNTFRGILATNIFNKGMHIMFRLWVRIIKDSRLVKDTVIEDASEDTRTHKIFNGLDAACVEFDLCKPIWLDSTVADFKRLSKARFTADNFIEPIDFDYMEIQVLEEDFL